MNGKGSLKLISSTMKKKGLSTVVVNVLMVGLILVAMGILWQIISGIMESSKEDAEFSQSKLSLKINSVFIDSSSVSLKISRLTGPGELEGLRFVFYDGISSELVENLTPLEELEQKTFYLALEKLRYSNLKTVSIAPIFILSSGNKRVGNILDTYTIRPENYNFSFYGDMGLSGFCESDANCSSDEPGSSACNTTLGDIVTYWTDYSCVLGNCVSIQEPRLAENCLDGCYIENATCVHSSECSFFSDCGVDGIWGFPFCDSGDLYENVIEYSCDDGFCSNEISQRMRQYCDEWGCTMGETEGECNPGLDCIEDSDCMVDSFILGSEYCEGSEIWGDWRDDSCLDNHCVNYVSQIFQQDCSEIEGVWDCIGGECIEYIECTQDSHCNPVGTCGRRCVDQECVVENVVNSGIVNSIWPSNIAEYFDSSSLPTSGDSYVGKFVKFTSGSEGRCLGVREHVYPTPPGIYSYLRMDVPATLVAAGNNYEVWETRFNCECEVSP
jgi:hypothetical protein